MAVRFEMESGNGIPTVSKMAGFHTGKAKRLSLKLEEAILNCQRKQVLQGR